MLEQIGRIVAAARSRSSRSLMDLSTETGVAANRLESLERGHPGMSTTELFEVARALSLDPVALLRGQERFRVVPSVFLRHAGHQDFDDRDHAVLDDALTAGQALAGLRARLGQPEAALQAGVFAPSSAMADHGVAPAHDGYRLARRVRAWVGDTSGPIGDLCVLLEERFGIAVLVRDLATARGTAASVRAGDAAAIVLNARDPHRRSNALLGRVHLAHELCHLLFDPSDGGLSIVVDLDGDKRTHAAEQRARAFAAEFLLPLPGLVALLGDPRGVSALDMAIALVARARSQFGTPHEIAVNHLCNLGFIDHRLREHVAAETSTFAGLAPTMSLPDVGRVSLLVRRYVQRAHEDGLVTDGEAKELLGLDRLDRLPWDEVAL